MPSFTPSILRLFALFLGSSVSSWNMLALTSLCQFLNHPSLVSLRFYLHRTSSQIPLMSSRLILSIQFTIRGKLGNWVRAALPPVCSSSPPRSLNQTALKLGSIYKANFDNSFKTIFFIEVYSITPWKLFPLYWCFKWGPNQKMSLHFCPFLKYIFWVDSSLMTVARAEMRQKAAQMKCRFQAQY